MFKEVKILYKLFFLLLMSVKNIWYLLFYFKFVEIFLFFIGILWISEERKCVMMKDLDEVDFVLEKFYYLRFNVG